MHVSMCLGCRSLGYCWLLIVVCLLSVSSVDCQSNQAPRFLCWRALYVSCWTSAVDCWCWQILIVRAQLCCTAMPLLALIWVSMHLQHKIYCVCWFWDFRPILIFARWLAGCRSAGLFQVSWGFCQFVLGGGSAKMWVNWGISGWGQHCQVRQNIFFIKNVFQFLNCFIFVCLQKFAKNANANMTPNRFWSHYWKHV